MAVGAALAVALLATSIAWPVYGRHAFLVALEILAPLGVVTALVADAIAGRPACLGGLRGQLAGGEELATLAADVKSMVGRIAAEERARRQLIAAISHDLRTPVTTLQLITVGLEDDISNQPWSGSSCG